MAELNKDCIINSCTNEVAFLCQCFSKDSCYFCKFHFSDHLLENRNHKFESLLLKPSSTQMISLIKSTEKALLHLSETRELLFKVSNKLISCIQRKQDQIVIQLDSYEKRIKKVFQRVLLMREFDKEDYEILLKADYLNPSSNFTDLGIVESMLERLFVFQMASPNDDAGLFYPDSNGILKIVNFQDFQERILEIEKAHIMSGAQCCKISNDKYFIHGGLEDYRSDVGKMKKNSTKCSNDVKGYNRTKVDMVSNFILFNIKTSLIDILPSTEPIGYAASLFKNNQIYVFGGKDHRQSYSTCLIFDLNDNSWSNFPINIIASFGNTASLCDGCILLTGFTMPNLYFVNEEECSLTSLLNFQAKTTKFVFEKWALTCENAIYEVSCNSGFSVTKFECNTQELQDEVLIIGRSFRKENYIYFILAGKKFMRLNVSTKMIEKINFRSRQFIK